MSAPPGAPDESDLLWRHLLDLPAFRALLRATEAKLYAHLLPLTEPVLDVGCGDGHFAAVGLDAVRRPLAAGVDPDARCLREAQGRHAYHQLHQARGDALPFPDATFATVISNSVLEHIPEVGPVLAEISRVLRHGGQFIFCVPSEHFTGLLFFTQLFRRLRCGPLARAYEHYFNRISRHHHCDGPELWKARLRLVGIEVTSHCTYFSASAHHFLDVGHYLGLPNLISRRLFGRWVLFPSRRNPILALTERRLRPLYNEAPGSVGAYLFFVARKA